MSPMSWIFITILLISMLILILSSFNSMPNLNSSKKLQMAKTPQIKW